MNAIALGSVVDIELNGTPMTIEIRRGEGDMTREVKLVSSEAALAKALLNGREGPAREGEEREFQVGTTLNTVRVVRVHS